VDNFNHLTDNWYQLAEYFDYFADNYHLIFTCYHLISID
jgi:hypothetical protein